MSFRHPPGAALFLLLALPQVIPLIAQDPRGKILGRVSDASGAVIPGVRVRAANTATNVAFSATTNELGNYEIPYLLGGTYVVSAEIQGFKKYVSEGIELRVGDRLTVDIALELGAMAETVTVSGGAPLLETNTASLGQVVDARRITELPLMGANALSLMVLAPGALSFNRPNHPTEPAAVETVSNISVGGTPVRNSEFTMDGTPTMWGRNVAFVPPADMVAEFKVQTSSYDASAGRTIAGVINMVLRSGTNKLHGALAERHTNNALVGMGFFQRRFLYDPSTGPVTPEKKKLVSPQLIDNQYSAVFSGPVVLPKVYDGRNRSFWIFGFDGLRRLAVKATNYSWTVPTLAQRTGDFSALLALGSRYQIYDPKTIAAAPGGRFSRQPLPGNVIPGSRLDATARGLLKYWSAPNATGTSDGRNNFFKPGGTGEEYSSDIVRFDHNFSDRHRIFGRYNQSHMLWTVAPVLNDDVSTGWLRHRYNKGFGLDDVYIFSPRLLLNLRYGLSRFIVTFRPNGQGFDLAAAGFSRALADAINPEARAFPQIAVDQYTTLGDSAAASGAFKSAAYTNYHTASAEFTRTHANHSIRFGGEVRFYQENASQFDYETPRIEFSSTWTRGPLDNSPAAPIGQGLASFLLGIPTGGRADVNASLAEQSTYYSAFVQDDWKITPRLTINLGVRYEYEGPLTERYNRSIRGFDFAAASPLDARVRANYARQPIAERPVDQFRLLGGLTFAGVAGQPRTLWNADKNNFSPRVGLAYSLTRTTVVRAGYGVFFGPLGSDRDAVNQGGFTQTTDLNPSRDNGLSFAASLSNPFPDGIQQPLGAAAGLLTSVGQNVSFFNARSLNPYIQRWSFGIQQKLPYQAVIEVSYVGNRGNKLAATRQLNPVPAEYLSTQPVRDQPVIDRLSAQVANPFYPLLPGTGLSGTTVARSQLLKPYPHFTGINTDEPVGFSWYHSLLARVERRFVKGFTVQGSYTWSKFMQANSYLNATDAALQHVIAGDDRTHMLAVSGVWELPFGRGRKWGSGLGGVSEHVLGGWQVQGVYQAQSGAPIGFGNVIYYGNLRDIALPSDQRTADRWFNTDGFERAPAKQLASNIRTFSSRLSGVRAHGLNNFDLSALKNFRIAERVKLQFRSEFMNAMNHTDFAAPNTTVTSTLFGRIDDARGFPRKIHFALKLLF
ncbi:MAG: TonB-dependent receptor domain-containing protein [Bryobacteraceae bacterium]